MAGIFVSLSLLGYVFFTRRLSRWPIEAIPMFVISAVILLCYSSAYFDVLKPVAAITIIFGALLLLASPFYLPKERTLLIEEYFTPGFSILIFYLVVFGVMAQTITVLDGWDEIVRWLPYAKVTYFHHSLVRPDYAPLGITYPTGGALFYYFMMRFSHYSEGLVSFAQLFFLLTPLTILLRKFTWKHWREAFIIFSFILIVLAYLFNLPIGPVSSIYMDKPVAMFFSGLLMSYFILRKNELPWLYLLVPAMAMVLFKPMILPFIMVTTVVILCDQYLIARENKLPKLPILLYCGVFIFPFLVLKTWALHLEKFNALHSAWSVKQFIHIIINRISPLNPEQFHTVLSNYLHALAYPTLFMVLMAAFVFLLCKKLERPLKVRIWCTHLWLAAGFIVYLTLLAFLYLFLFSPSLALSLNSLQRFYAIYYIGWLLMLEAQVLYFTGDLVLDYYAKFSSKFRSALVYLIILFLTVYTAIYTYGHHQDFLKEKHSEYMRYAMKQAAKPVAALTKTDSRVFVLWMGQGNLLGSAISYELLPRYAKPSLGQFKGLQEFNKAIQEYNYLVIGKVSPKFWRKHKNDFASNNRTPITTLNMCLKPFPGGNCQAEKIPIYLFKIERKADHIKLKNVLND